MKGATTEPCASISKPPSINITMMIGASHNFYVHEEKPKALLEIPFDLPLLKLLFEGVRFYCLLREIQ